MDQTVKEWLKDLEWRKEIEERINPFTGETDNMHHYSLSLEIGASGSISEKDEENAPEMLDYIRETLEHKIEEYVDKLVFNKVNQENNSGFHVSVKAHEPIVVLHPKYYPDILRDGVFIQLVNLYNSLDGKVKQE